jgi:hypothetical protein
MKRLALALLLLSPTLSFAARPKANPADYNVTIQIVFSRYIFRDLPSLGSQQLETMIGGQQVELRSVGGAVGVLALGEYKAKLIATFTNDKNADGYIPKNPNAFDQCAIYQFLLPDGSTRDYYVIGLGPKAPYGATPPSPANP